MKMFTTFLFSKTTCTNNIIIINSTKTFLKYLFIQSKKKNPNIIFRNYCSCFASCRTKTTKMYISTTKCFSIIINFVKIYFTLFLKNNFLIQTFFINKSKCIPSYFYNHFHLIQFFVVQQELFF